MDIQVEEATFHDWTKLAPVHRATSDEFVVFIGIRRRRRPGI